ncbi:MAG TPA: serine/threonine-protein kinase [Polyangiaceae bacterium]|jgi:serine/threonine-protein kinase|nr:serine/threonine-protein kinase [Polyangiaceae bacterium]
MPTTVPPGEEPSFGGYRVVAKVRSGPITDLYRAEQTELGRPVFIKALGRGILPSSPFAAALEREARLLTELDHPGVIRVLDFVRGDRAMWLVLEHVDGFSLDEIVARKGKLAPNAAVAVAVAIADAIGHAHGRGVIHRDVQPHNVLVAKSGAVKLVNFAAAADERLPTAPELLEGSSGFGTPAYMSPEQLLGEPEDARSDLYSLGVVLYEMLTGKRPFDAGDDRPSSKLGRHDSMAPPSRSVPAIPASLDRAVRRCLAKLPSDRFATAAELSRTLSAELDVPAAPPADAIAAELVRLGLVTGADAAKKDVARPSLLRKKPLTVGTALRGYLVALALIVAGGAAIERTSIARRGDGARSNAGRLELVPANAGFLRVAVDPWANVIVDGVEVETTPFAHSIPLSPGVHYVRLEHPKAPVERRTVTLSAGETVLLDVKMDLPRQQVVRPETSAGPSLTDPSTP